MDFGIFQEQKIPKVFVVKNIATKTVHFQENAASSAPGTSSGPTATASSASKRVHHPNVICDGCDKDIWGYRYKCLECHDFDLCMECEPKLHNHHLMVRIADPGDADICYRSKLGKRFLRHRRSEGLSTKSEEKDAKRHHHKRHASSASGVRPPTTSELLYNLYHSYANPNVNANANANVNGSTNAGTNTEGAGSQSETTPTNSPPHCKVPPTTPANGPSQYGFVGPNGNGKPPCVPLKNGIDMFANIAHNFAAMMDPFATFMENANAYASAASNASTASAAATSAAATSAATTSTASAPSTPSAAPSVPASDNSTVSAEAEAKKIMDAMFATASGQSQNTEMPAVINNQDKAAEKEDEVVIVDCSDTEEEDLRRLVTALNVNQGASGEASSAEPTSSTKNEAPISAEVADKGS